MTNNIEDYNMLCDAWFCGRGLDCLERAPIAPCDNNTTFQWKQLSAGQLPIEWWINIYSADGPTETKFLVEAR